MEKDQNNKTNGGNEQPKGSFPRLLKKKPNVAHPVNVQRFHALASEGLTTAQVQQRTEQGLVNKTGKK